MITINTIKAYILGTRGSVPISSTDSFIYGGNTQCVMLEFNDTAVIFDGGTGIMSAHTHLSKNPAIKSVHIFLSHYHLDHLIGLPVAQVILNGKYNVIIYGPDFEGNSPKALLDDLFKPPFWPVNLTNLSNISFVTLESDQSYKILDATISTIPLNHPNNSLGFKFLFSGKSICYIFDHEHNEDFEEEISSFIKGADLLLLDAPYTIDEYEIRRGYGHSTTLDATTLADNNSVLQMIISHHDLFKNDKHLQTLNSMLTSYNPKYCLAKEGMVIEL